MSYQPLSYYNRVVNEDFVLQEGQTYDGNILVKHGSFKLETGAAVLSELKFIPNDQKVVLEDHSFIYHLHMMNGGELYLKGNARIIELLVEDRVILHVPKTCTNWRAFFESISNDSLITIVQDYD